jgi:CBS domain-containing protein
VIPHTSSVFDAIDRMADTGFSQLPVQRDGVIIGIFSWRSFAKRAGDLRESSIKPSALSVQDCLEPPRFISRETYIDTDTDWSELDHVLVGSASELLGILTISDVWGRLNDFAEAFVLVDEIESELRDLIDGRIEHDEFASLVAGLSLPPGARQPQQLIDLSFDQYRQVITSKSQWPQFARYFTAGREVVDNDIKTIAQLRNEILHFRRRITTRDTDRLRRFRDGLRFGVQACSADESPSATPPSSTAV